MSLSTTLALLLVLLVGLGLGLALGLALGVLRRSPLGGALGAGPGGEARDTEVLEGLDRLHDTLRDLEHARVSWQGQLHQQVDDVRRSADGLRRETHQLTTALRRPQVRGRWGELHLRRTVELAGLVDRCDFSEQVRLDDGAQRPDLVVHLAGGRDVVVDAKVPLDAFLDAAAAADDAERDHHLTRHARQVRTHVDQLGSKAYWKALEGAALAEQARAIHRLGVDLHQRLQVLDRHLDNVGRSLNAAVGHYNQAMGSLESRVLVSARRFTELSVTDEDLPAPRTVELRAVERSFEREDQSVERDRSTG